MTPCCDALPPLTPHPAAKPALRRAWPLTLAALLLGLAACASAPTPPAVATADLPSRWAEAPIRAAPGAYALEAAWWGRFNDPVLTGLVERALRANTQVVSAQAALRQARALRDVTAASLQPAVGGSGSARRGSAGGQSTGNLFQTGLDASWELDLFGANRSALASGDATAQASAASLAQVQVSIAAEVALAYIALRGAQAQQGIARANLASQQETLQITEWRLQAGLVTVLDVEQARSAALQTNALLPALASRVGQTRHALAVLTGQPPAALAVTLATTLANMRAADPMADPASGSPSQPPAGRATLPYAAAGLALAIPADTLRQRADVQAAEWRVAAAAAQVDQANAARAPNFKLGGTLGLNALTLGALSSGAAVVGSVLASVSLPVWDGGAGLAQVRAQQAALDQTKSAYRATVLTALQEVEDALLALANDQARLLSLQAAAEAASNAAVLARQRYSSGLVDFQTVLQTQRSQLSTQDSVASASTDLGSDQVRLYKALGGGWQATPGSAAGAAPALATLQIPIP
jgi:multidrug efflux system outer membrane protein